jgi:hypothetical protein
MQQLIAQCDLNIERQLAAIADRTNPSQDSEPTLQLQDLAGCKPRKRKSKWLGIKFGRAFSSASSESI